MGIGSYILDDQGNPVIEANLDKWARWFERLENRVLRSDHVGEVHVSTVFLGVDHSFSSAPKPILWETMIFGGHYDQRQWRYDSREAAEKGHRKALKLVTDRAKKISEAVRVIETAAKRVGIEDPHVVVVDPREKKDRKVRPK